jgi:DNA-binding NarL/FixJ family response regulator
MKHPLKKRQRTRAGAARGAAGSPARFGLPAKSRAKAPARWSPTARAGKRKILLVDDHPIVRQGLVELINRQKNLVVCGETGSGREAPELARRLNPDLAVIDVSLKDESGIQLLKTLKLQRPRLPLLVLSMHEEGLYAERALRAGAMGYIMKQEASDVILKAIHSALNGEIYLSERIKEKLLHHLVEGKSGRQGFSVDLLSDRELEIFQLIGNGFGTRQIAEKLHLSVKTIESYRESLKQKLQLKDRSELVQQAIHWARDEAPPV